MLSVREKELPKFNMIENQKTFDVTAFVAAYYYPTKPGFTPHWEQYNFSQIILVLNGNGIFYTKEGAYPIRSGMMIYRPAFAETMYEWSSDKASFALIDFVCRSEAMSAFEKAPFTLNEEESATLLDLMKTGAGICEHIMDDEKLMGMKIREGVPDVVLSFIYSSLERFLAMVYCRLNNIHFLMDESQTVNRFIHQSKLVAEVQAYLNEHLSEQVTIGQLCEHFWLSQTALMRKFRKEIGQGVMEYFADLKIAEAKRRIARGNCSFTEISEELGFSSVNYFSKVFKAKMGMTPTEYSKFSSKRRVSAILQAEEE